MTIKHLMRVRSSYIKALGYRDGEATVRFHSGLVRNYPMDIRKFQAWLAAPSIGRYFKDHVKHTRGQRKAVSSVKQDRTVRRASRRPDTLKTHRTDCSLDGASRQSQGAGS